MEKQIEEHSVNHFISGMAIGVDMYAAEIVLDLKAKYPQITLEAAVPANHRRINGRLSCKDDTTPYFPAAIRKH